MWKTGSSLAAPGGWNEPDPEFTVTADGLLGEDKLEDLDYVLTREPGEDPGVRIIMLDGEPTLGNYRVQYKSGILTIGEKPAADTTQMSIYITSSWPEQRSFPRALPPWRINCPQ